jgi:hypothetical protein
MGEEVVVRFEVKIVAGRLIAGLPRNLNPHPTSFLPSLTNLPPSHLHPSPHFLVRHAVRPNYLQWSIDFGKGIYFNLSSTPQTGISSGITNQEDPSQ